MKRILLATAAALFTATSAGAWGYTESSDVEVMRQLDRLVEQSNKSVGLPAIRNFFEKRMMRMIYEKRDDPNYSTITYIVTMNGDFVKLCDSIGFGMNASIQYTNPIKPADITETPKRDFAGYELDLVPQAEANGLFMPEGLAATYVLCVDEANEDLVPVYAEPEIIVSPFPLGGVK